MKKNIEFKNPENKNIVDGYLEHKASNGLSKNTLEFYEGVLYRCLSTFPELITELTSKDLWQWLKLNYDDKSPLTKLSVYKILHTFFKNQFDRGLLKKSPVLKHWRPQPIRLRPKYIKRADIHKLKIESEKLSNKDRAIFELLRCTGLRMTEARKIKIRDVDLLDRKVKVTGKGNKERWAFFTKECSYLLERLIENRDENEYLFVNKNGQMLGRGYIWLVISTLGVLSEMIENIYPHRLRHSFATRLLENGVDLETIKHLLGHVEKTDTTTYAQLSDEEAFRLYNKFMR